jgi:hypothetical protein
MYAFFNNATIDYVAGRRCHVFKCANRGCKHSVRHYLDKKDAKSTGNMRCHVLSCWGEAAVKMAEKGGDAAVAKEKVVNSILQTGSITASFEIQGKHKVTYSNIQHTKSESRWVLIHQC